MFFFILSIVTALLVSTSYSQVYVKEALLFSSGVVICDS